MFQYEDQEESTALRLRARMRLTTKSSPQSDEKKPLSLPNKLLRIAACVLALLIGFDIVGVLACTVVDFLSAIFVAFQGMVVIYTIWIVLGIFTGIYTYVIAGSLTFGARPRDWYGSSDRDIDWTDRQEAPATGLTVCLIAFPILVGMSELSILIGGSSESIYVPGNTPLSITYFVTVAITMSAAQVFLYQSRKSGIPPAPPSTASTAADLPALHKPQPELPLFPQQAGRAQTDRRDRR